MTRYELADHVVTTSSDDRVVFPDAGITKGEVIAYYHRVAELILPHLRDRPLTMERFPKGLGGKGFYHKHAPTYFPGWIERADMAGKEERVVYAVCNNAAALVYIANQNTLAFHVWASRKQTPQRPDILIFDLDPPEGKFELVVRTALILRELLTDLGLTPLVKTTGSKGLHVVVGLDGADDYDTVQQLAGAVAERVCAEHPDLATTEFYKKDRAGRLFVDTLRNAYGATAVAPYSLRARPNAPVATPLRWDEVDDPELSADRYHLGNIGDRLDSVGDLWSGLFEQPGSARAVLDRLTG